MLTGVETEGTTEEEPEAAAEEKTETKPETGSETAEADLRAAAEEETGTEVGGGIYLRRKCQIQHLISKNKTYNWRGNISGMRTAGALWRH
jgi:hypothetical protein